MSKTWKWILGIVLVLVVVGAFAMVGYAWRTHSFVVASARVMPFGDAQEKVFDGQPQPFDRNWNGPMMEPGYGNDVPPHMWKGEGGYGAPMMYERGFSSDHRGFSAFGGLVHLALFFGLLYGAYWLGRRNARIVMDPKPVAPVAEPATAPEASPADPEADASPAPRKRGKKTE